MHNKRGGNGDLSPHKPKIDMKKERKRSGRRTKRELTEMLLNLFAENPDREFYVKDLYRQVGANTHPGKMLTLDVLEDLVLADYLTTDGQGHYRYAVRQQVMEGTFQRKRNGRNSFVPDDGGKSILVAERNALHAMDGDRVRVTMLARRYAHTREAQVIEILERAKDTFVGKLRVEHGFAFLITEDRALATDIFIPKKDLGKGCTGDKAVVRITDWPAGAKSPVGKVVDILGREGENDAEMHAILAEYNLPYNYPRRVEEAAERIPDGVTPEEIARREDFRSVTTFTIDPRDAKDFDDAISIRPMPAAHGKVYEVGVHIADVTHYIKEGDLIDREAQQRATSVYLVDRTIPMLPERLCNNLCSLREDEEKLAYSVIFRLSEDAKVQSWRLAKTVIRSNRRFTYEEVQYILEQNGEASAEDLAHPAPKPQGEYGAQYTQDLITLNRLAKFLRERRFKAGAIGFDRPEVRFETDEKGHPISTYIKQAKDANKLVEEFMLLANRTVAESIGNLKLTGHGQKAKKRTFVYRIHDVPDPEKLEKLSGFIGTFGYKIRTDGSKKDISKSLNRLLKDVKGKAEENVVEMVALRAMQKARYDVENIGHYGLMFDYYTHFTSPIRRYPDMMVHRLLARYAGGGRSANKEKYQELCVHSSSMEQLAETAERASVKYKQVEFMADRLGQEFEGMINGVTEFGLYVELDDNHCEGLVPLRDLVGDYYEFDERNFCLVGRHEHRRYGLGGRVRIRVERANLDRRQLLFTLVDEEGRAAADSPPKNWAEMRKNKRRERRKYGSNRR